MARSAASRQPAPTRLPAGGPPSRAAEILLGLLALVGVVALVFGVPWLLVRAFDPPWPSEAPTTSWLTEQVDADTVLTLLSVVVWLAWLHFVVCLVVEAVAEIRGRGLSPRVPGGGVGTQALARRLVALVLLLVGAGAATLPTAAALAAEAPQQSVASVQREGQRDTRYDTRRDRDRQADADIRASGSVQAAAAMQADDAQSVLFYQVKPPDGRNYDTLWDIANRYLGSGLRYKELVELNRGVLQPDGSRMTNPDLIYPGQVIRMPADAQGAGLLVADPTRPGIAPDVAQPDVAQPVGALDVAPPAGGSIQQVGDRRGSDPAEGPPTTTTTTTDAGAGAVDGGFDLPDQLAPVFGAAGGLLTAGLLAALRRRRGWDRGPRGGGGLPLDSELALRAEADGPTAALLDRSLRTWTGDGRRGELPAPAQCAVSPGGIAVSFASTPDGEAPRPWQTERAGRVWTLRREAARRLPNDPGTLSPLPGLVTAGRRDDGSLLLVDLESVPGVVALGGDNAVARDVAVSWALELATHAWADRRRVTMVGFADDLEPVAVDTVRRVDDLDRALEQLEGTCRHQRQACAELGAGSVRTGRALRPDPRLWTSHLLVLSGVPDAERLSRVQAVASDPHQGVSVVMVGDHQEAAARVVASTEGRLWCGPLGIDVQAQRLTVDASRGLVDLFSAAATTDLSGGPSDPLDPLSGLSAGLLDPEVLDLSTRQPVEIGVLGPVAVDADGPVDEGRRDLLTEVVLHVAAHPDGVHPQVLASAVWPRGVDDEVRDATLAKAREWLGRSDDGSDRLALADGRWVLGRQGVRFDWDVFRALVNAASAPGADPVPPLDQALGLVRGEAWDDLPAHRYAWLAHSLEVDVRLVVVATARRLAAVCRERGDLDGAWRALSRGQVMVPAAEELWQDKLRLAAAGGDRAALVEVVDDMDDVLARHGSPLGASPTTDALVGELLPGHRRRAA